jgi:hypothetical protein
MITSMITVRSSVPYCRQRIEEDNQMERWLMVEAREHTEVWPGSWKSMGNVDGRLRHTNWPVSSLGGVSVTGEREAYECYLGRQASKNYRSDLSGNRLNLLLGPGNLG